MQILTWVGLGLVSGILARILMPGSQSGGLVRTTLLGIVGASIGGYLGTSLGFGAVDAFDLRSIGVATGGALVFLFVWQLIFGRKG